MANTTRLTVSLTAIARMSTRGTLVEPPANQTFSVADPQKVWFVLSGALHLFFVEVRQDGSTGCRHNLFRVSEGCAVYGIPETSGSGLQLLASPGSGTKLVCLDQTQIEPVLPSSGSHPLLVSLERWISEITIAATDGVAPKSFARLAEGQQTTFDDDPGVALAVDKLLWVRPIKGTAHFLGNTGVPALSSQCFFPLSRGSWVQCSAHTTLECIDSQTLLRTDPNWSSMREFSSIALGCLHRQVKETEQRQGQRIRVMAEANATSVEEALRGLIRPLQQSAKDVFALVETGTSDPLLSACQAVGQASGIQIKPSATEASKTKQRDPVTAIAKASGVHVRRVLLRGRWWNEDNGPLLGFMSANDQPVALIPLSSRHYRLFNPADKQITDVNEEEAGKIKEIGYVFYRGFPLRQLKVRDLIKFSLHRCFADIATILIVGVGAGILALVPPIFTGIIFDDIIPRAQRHALTQLTLFLVVTAVATSFFSLCQRFAVIRVEGKMDASTQAAVWDRTIGLPAPFFRNYTAGDLAMRALAIGQIRKILTGTTLSYFLSGIFSVFSFLLLFYYSWRLALVATGLMAVAALVSFLCGYFQMGYQRELSTQQGKMSGLMLQFIQGMAKFRVAGAEARVFAVWAREFTKQKSIYFRARRLTNALHVFRSVFPVLAYAAIFYCAAELLFTGVSSAMSTGEFLAFFVAFSQFLFAGLSLSDAAVTSLGVLPLIERAKPILNTLPEVESGRADPGELSGRIDVNHLSFAYRPDMPPIIKDLSLNIASGEFVAFVGPSGSGKSTLFRLLLGFEKPAAGGIYYDGQDLSTLDLYAVRRQLGVVLQHGRLLTGDIFTNIVGSAPLSFDDAWEAARLAGLDRDIENMPMGMHTIVSEGGGGFSGGQRQRLMIARAIVGKPRILLFDEATSALDNYTQAIVAKSLENLNATRLVIAHRLSTVVNADCIYVLDKGQIVQSGTYQDLIREPGLFADLAKRQLTEAQRWSAA